MKGQDGGEARADEGGGVVGCLSEAQVARLADGDDPGGLFERHAAGCSRCGARAAAARRDAVFLTRVRTLTQERLGPSGAPRVTGYRVVRELSAGSQGVVYQAVQESTQRAVAIKTVSPAWREEGSASRQRRRAEREAEIAARLRHPNIVSVYESRTLGDGRLAVVMEYVDGVRLDEWRPAGANAEERRRSLLRVFVEICGAVHHAHLNGVIHRDLKPENILVAGAGGEQNAGSVRPVVLDFGVAKSISGHDLSTTQTGEFAGTPAYASPEQAAGRADEVDALTDVYSLGVILYRLLCGAMPYDLGGSIFDIARTIAERAPAPPRTHDPTIALDLSAIVLRALRKEKGERYQSAASLGRDVERFLRGAPVDARSGSGWYVLGKAVSMNRRRLGWVGVGVLVLAGAAAGVGLSAVRAARSERRAESMRAAARAEGIRARAVTAFMREALPSADPERPEVVEAVNAGLGRLYAKLETGVYAGEPELDQALRRLWGEVYSGLGSGKARGFAQYADVSLRNGLVWLRMQHAGDHPEIAAMLHEHAGVQRERGRYQEAAATCREALAMRERLLGAEAPVTAESRALLARILLDLGDRPAAEAAASAVLGVLRPLGGPESNGTIAAMASLKARCALMRAGASIPDDSTAADADRRSADLREAEAFALEALTKRAGLLMTNDPDLLDSLQDAAETAELAPGGELAALMRTPWAGVLEEGKSLRQAVADDCALMTGPAPYSGSVRRLPGRSAAMGRYLALQARLLGDDDPALVGTLLVRADAAETEGEFEVRKEAFTAAAALLERRHGRRSFSVLATTEVAGSFQSLWGDIDEAVRLGEYALEVWESVPEHARDQLLVGNCRRRLAWYLLLSGRTDRAVGLYTVALRELQGAVGSEHYTCALAEAGLAYARLERGDLAGAEAQSAAALAKCRAWKPGTPIDQLVHVAFVRGHVLGRQGRWSEALPLLEEAWEPQYAQARRLRWRALLIDDAIAGSTALGDMGAQERWRAEAAGPIRAAPAVGE